MNGAQSNSSSLVCTVCNNLLILMGEDISSTLVGYARGECGAPHDDNRATRVAWCQAGHPTRLSIQRTCENCNWRGKDGCHCHEGLKLDTWPKLPVGRPPLHVEAKSAVTHSCLSGVPRGQWRTAQTS